MFFYVDWPKPKHGIIIIQKAMQFQYDFSMCIEDDDFL